MLDVDKIRVAYGKNVTLMDISFEIHEKEIVALLGRNGAGKTTTLRTISGLLTPISGEIHFLNKRINGISPQDIVKIGISHAPERRRLFSNMTVRENLEMGAYTRNDKAGIDADIEQLYKIFPILGERYNQLAGTLSGGEQQMLCIARALIAKPKLLLLDEPTLGLSPIIVEQLAHIIERINAAGTGIFLVEQNANMALNTSQRAYVMEGGKIVLEGNSKDLMEDERVKKSYLGM